ncbi:MAG TPA: hypothetical protein PLF40_20465 [Kofleriaceae bacterium]|nr:hypothetical protein [Kofleriaceae bacterium]
MSLLISQRAAAMGAALVLSACGLVDTNIADFNLTLPEKQFTVDASTWNVNAAATSTFLTTSCATMPTICGQAAASACKAATCTGTCDAGTKTCVLSLGVSNYKTIDLITEKPELKTINEQPVIKVSIDRVTYSVSANSLNVASPEMTVYVAPATVMTAGDAQAKPIGKIPSVPAGTTLPATEITFTDSGRAELINVMSNFKVPFNIIIGSTLVVNSATMIPTGKMESGIQITAHAGL